MHNLLDIMYNVLAGKEGAAQKKGEKVFGFIFV